jgi:murein DD-endopeptidase MepM/ murein hydrolase activator NlpD
MKSMEAVMTKRSNLVRIKLFPVKFLPAISITLLAVLSLAFFTVQAKDQSNERSSQTGAYEITYAEADGFQYPVGGASDHAGWQVILCFGCSGPLGAGHLAEDFGNENGQNAGQPVYAAANGVVKYATGNSALDGYGGAVIIEHHLSNGNYYTTIYGHLAHPVGVKVGQEVTKGQQVGVLADDVNDGGSWKPHLHFGIRKGPFDGGNYSCSDGYTNWVYLGYSHPCNFESVVFLPLLK